MRRCAVLAGVGGHVPPAGAHPTTVDLAVPAAAAALRSAQVSAVDLLVLATATQDHAAAEVAARLGLDARALDIETGCAAFGYGLSVVESMLTAGRASLALLVGVDTADASPLSTDAAGAVVLRAGEPCESGAVHGHDSGELRSGCRPGDRHAAGRMLTSARTALGRAGWTAADVEILIAHQADAIALGAGLGIPTVTENPGTMGNTVAASIPLALAQVSLAPGTRTLLSAFGGAGTWGAVALKWPRPAG